MLIHRSTRVALVGALVLAMPMSQAQACNWLRGCGQPATTTFYAPVAAAPAPVAQVVNYMPQTCFRTVYVNTPVVSYSPVRACDACGNSTTVMRPVTSYVMRPQLVPYTTYRQVVAAMPVAMPVAQPCCGATPAPVTAAYFAAPAPVAFAPAPQPAASCCSATQPLAASAPMASPTFTPQPSLTPQSYSGAQPLTPSAQPLGAPQPLSAPPLDATQRPTLAPYGANPAAPSGTPGATIRSLSPSTAQPSLSSPTNSPSLSTNNSAYPPSQFSPPPQPLSLSNPPSATPQTNLTPTPQSSSNSAQALTAPGNSTPADSAPQNKTFDSGSEAEPQSRLLLPPRDSNNSSTSTRPRGLDPEDQDRTTAVPIRQSRSMQAVSTARLIAPPAKPAARPAASGEDGWRAARP